MEVTPNAPGFIFVTFFFWHDFDGTLNLLFGNWPACQALNKEVTLVDIWRYFIYVFPVLLKVCYKSVTSFEIPRINLAKYLFVAL